MEGARELVVRNPDLGAELALRATEISDPREFRLEVLKLLGSLVGYESAIFTDVYEPREPVTLGVDAAKLKSIQYCETNYDRYAADMQRFWPVGQRVGGCIDHEIYSTRERRELPFYRDIVQKQGVRSMLVLLASWRGKPVAMVRFDRHDARGFQQDELDRARRLLPILQIALAARSPEPSRSETGTLPRLTPREDQIARHVARGLTSTQIGLILGTSRFTVRNQIGRIFDKLGVASRAELATWVTRHLPGA